MTDQITAPSRTATGLRPALRHAWRRWWLRASMAKQRRQLENVLTDPHVARDLGLPVRERPPVPHSYW